MAICLLCPPCLAAGTDEEKSEKETSLYLYYQKHLNPYISALRQQKAQDSVAGPEQKAMQSAPESILSTKKKPDTGEDGQGASYHGKKTEKTDDKAYISLYRTDSIGREEINKALPSTYGREYVAELALGLKLAPSLDLFLGKAQKFERTENTPWGSHDDGWRIRLQTNF